MATNYREIRDENERRFGTEIGRIGALLLANRYDDRTHFIYELLQNAEDALTKRVGWTGSRSVTFRLDRNALYITHFGKPFDGADVRAICGIGESTKDLTAIGRFGIGFKSVYAFTDRPEVHSGDEDFAIESFVWPIASATRDRKKDETLIVIPLRNEADRKEIATGLQRLGLGALLFLRQIEEIGWSTADGLSGRYYRSHLKYLDEGVRQIKVVSHAEGHSEIGERWLVFSRPVLTPHGEAVGNVEIGFSLNADEGQEHEKIRPVARSPLIVFFPTVVETHLKFLVQGPYRTTPSRDNIPHHDPWNQYCVTETSGVLVDALDWLRDNDMLDADVLQCLPLDREKFSDNSMFEPIFSATKLALSARALIPRFGGGYSPAHKLKLARTQELRELFQPRQLGLLLGSGPPLDWVSSDISQDRTPEVRRYLVSELGIDEVRSDSIVSDLNAAFLQQQSNTWITRLYEFLGSLSALRWRFESVPLVRLSDGTHVLPQIDGRPAAVLPSKFATGFPTVREAVCKTKAAKDFLRSLGLTEPDPVDDVIWHVLPKYRDGRGEITDRRYESDFTRIVTAFSTDSKAQREKLVSELRTTLFVKAVAAKDGRKTIAQASDIYFATERLRELFAGVAGILFLDTDYKCLQGEAARSLLEACDAARFLQQIRVDCDVTWERKRELRRNAGLERFTWQQITDFSIRGLDGLLEILPMLPSVDRKRRASVLWDALEDYADRRGTRGLLSEYRWSYSHETKAIGFDSALIRALNAAKWIPDLNGTLQQPQSVLFESLGWKANPVLQDKILFKPPVIDQLAHAAGIEPGVLTLLKELGVTSEEELRRRLVASSGQAEPAKGTEQFGEGAQESGRSSEFPESSSDSSRTEGQFNEGESGGGRLEQTASSGGRKWFVSYVAANPQDSDSGLTSLEAGNRKHLEEQAISLVLSCEPEWRRTPENNPGFDLYQGETIENATQWCEVKGMAGAFTERPVGMSRVQFRTATDHGKSYWLYVVERAGTEAARLIRIQDPAGKAETFTFDHGWISVADGAVRGGAAQN